jgi:CcmD family protein
MTGILRAVAWLSIVITGALGAAGAALAQGEQEFVPATQLGEQLPAAPLVFWAYALCWLVLLGYVFMLWRKLNRVHRELADAAARLPQRR